MEDRRGRRTVAAGGGLGALAIVVMVVLLGGDPSAVLQLLGGGGASGGAAATEPPPPERSEEVDFVSVVLGSTEDVWGGLFSASGYRAPTLVLFTGSVRSACGFNTAATGPFYCPPDQKVYLDLSFFDELARMGGAGEPALRSSRAASRLLRRRVGHHANRASRMLEPGDVDEGLAAAGAIGDDRIIRRAGREAVPESFTHGTSAQRQRWLTVGLETGDPSVCDTLAG